MFNSLTKTATAAAFAVGLALAGTVVTSADAAMRHSSGGVHSGHGGYGGRHGGGYGGQYAGGYGGYGGQYAGGGGYGYGGYGYGGYGYGGYGCPQFPIGLVTGYC